jgi:hypothetical protein
LGGFIGAPLLCLGGPKRQQGELFPCDTNVEGRGVCSRTCKGEGFTHNTNVGGFALGHARARGLPTIQTSGGFALGHARARGFT